MMVCKRYHLNLFVNTILLACFHNGKKSLYYSMPVGKACFIHEHYTYTFESLSIILVNSQYSYCI